MNPLKEQRKLRREMEQKIFSSLTPEQKEAAIKDRISESQAKRLLRITRTQSIRNQVREGLEYARKNSVAFFAGNYAEFCLGASALLKTADNGSVYYQVGYCICARKDYYTERVAQGLSAFRVKNPDGEEYTFRIPLSKRGALSVPRLCALIAVHIEMDVVTQRIKVSKALFKMAVRCLISNGHCFLRPERVRNEKTQPVFVSTNRN